VAHSDDRNLLLILQHGGDAAQSLASLSSVDSIRAEERPGRVGYLQPTWASVEPGMIVGRWAHRPMHPPSH
jgi:hypothetical protein